MSSELLLDAAGRRRPPAAMPGHNAGHAPGNKGRVYPADPPTVDEIVAVMRQTPPDRHGLRLRALIVVLWRGGLRIQEVLSLIESDLDPRRGSILIRGGKGNRRREIGMDAWAWSDHLAPWLAARVELPVGALFCVIDGPTRGRPWSATAARGELRRYAAAAGVRRSFVPHQLRHAPRGRARAGGGAAAGDPAPARAFVRLDHECLPARDRRRGDHRHDPRATRADDARQRRPRTLRRAGQAGGSAARRNRPPAPHRRGRVARLRQHDPPRRRSRGCSQAAGPSRPLELDQLSS